MTLTTYLKRFTSVDLLLLSYILITSGFILAFYSSVNSAGLHLSGRLIFIIVLLLLPLTDKFLKNPAVYFFRIAYPLIILPFFYTETDALNNLFFKDLDYHFARYDSLFFGYQPSLAFSEAFPGKFFSEMMNFGYFSYYFLIAAFVFYIFIHDNRSAFIRSVFYITCSFLIYYILFIIIPVSGPQYFFKHPYNQVPDSGIFRSLVKFVEFVGERPTAAFPSSHVGMVLIMILIAWREYFKTLFWLVPFFLLLSLSTVYIKAHYAVDVIGGIISAPLVLRISQKIFITFNKRDCNFI